MTIKKVDESLVKHTLILDALKETKAVDIVSIDLIEVENAAASWFVICHAQSTTQVAALSDSVQRKLKSEINLKPYHVEGKDNSIWILMDYGEVMVHIFEEENRQFYKLEALWADGKLTRISDE